MLDISSLIEGLKINNIGVTDVSTPTTTSIPIPTVSNTVDTTDKIITFDVSNFQKELKQNSERKNKYFHNNSDRFNAYDVAHTCIRSALFRILKYPIRDYSDSWLPVKLRTNLGSACHEFIQSSTVFTEDEVYMRVPSLNISTKLDCLINNNVLIEIKSCNYTDYATIIKNNLPRTKDLYQAVLYRYLIQNHLEESRQQELSEDEKKKYHLPKLKEYNIKVIQFIYICHELIAAETESIEQDIEFSKRLKKFLNSKNNKFWFIKELQLNVDNFDISNIEKHVTDKLFELKKYYDNKQIPDMKHRHVDLKSCFFCLFKDVCSKN